MHLIVFTYLDHNNAYNNKWFWHEVYRSVCLMFIQPEAFISNYHILVDNLEGAFSREQSDIITYQKLRASGKHIFARKL